MEPDCVCEPWPVDPTCLPDAWADDPADWDDTQRNAIQIASEILRRLTGGTYGPCRRVVRPCQPDRGWPCEGICGCGPLCTVTLPAYTSRIETVLRDGNEICDGWRLYDYSLLVMPKGQCFPACQRLDLPLSAPGTWGIVYWEGLPIDGNPAAIRAVTRLAVEIWKDCNGGECALPERVTQVTREGVTYSFEETDGLASIGRFGIAAIDGWLDIVNPGRNRAPLQVYSPDMPRRFYPTGGAGWR